MDGLAGEEAGGALVQHRQSRFEEDLRGAAGSATEPLTAEALTKILKQQLEPIKKDIAAIKQHGVSQEDLSKT
eukprot:447635-Pyramimonas_sp.AAC.1